MVAETRAIVFDYGNVIVKTDREAIVQGLCRLFDSSEIEIRQAVMQAREVRHAGGHELGFWEDWAEKNGIELPGDWMKQYSDLCSKALKVNLDMVQLAQELKQGGYTTALLSNSILPKPLFMKTLGQYGELFNCIILSHDVKFRKPDPQIFRALFNELKLKPEECLFIDDSEKHIKAGERLGMDGIVFKSHDQLTRELAQRKILLEKDEKKIEIQSESL